LAVAATTVFAGGNLLVPPMVAPIAVMYADPVAIGCAVVLGVLLYPTHRHFKIRSLRAYVATGFLMALSVAAWCLWSSGASSFSLPYARFKKVASQAHLAARKLYGDRPMNDDQAGTRASECLA
jgi:hypothetical protein